MLGARYIVTDEYNLGLILQRVLIVLYILPFFGMPSNQCKSSMTLDPWLISAMMIQTPGKWPIGGIEPWSAHSWLFGYPAVCESTGPGAGHVQAAPPALLLPYAAHSSSQPPGHTNVCHQTFIM